MNCVVEQMKASDWAQVREIYLEGIRTGHGTFETDAPTWEHWDESHLQVARLVVRDGERSPAQDVPRLMAQQGARVLGWAALSLVSRRHVYRGVAELTVYVAEAARGRGLGRMLLEALIAESERNGIWTLQASIFPENVASVELHRRCGFRKVGRRERIGMMNGMWRDTLLFERRSGSVGML